MHERGVIVHRERSQQIRSFKNLQYGTITPTDIDGFIDYHDKVFIYFELKYRDAEIPDGQRLALERVADAAKESGRIGLSIIATHDVTDVNDDIDAASGIVVEYRLDGKWHNGDGTTTVENMCTDAIKRYEASRPRTHIEPKVTF